MLSFGIKRLILGVNLRNTPIRFIRTLVISEPLNSDLTIPTSTLSSINAAKSFNNPIHLLMTGKFSYEAASTAKNYHGIEKIFYNNSESSRTFVSDATSHIISELVKRDSISIIVGPVSSSIKDVFPRLGAYLDTQPITDVISIQNESTFIRMTYAGNAETTISSSDNVKIISIRSSAFDNEVSLKSNSSPSPIEEISINSNSKISILENLHNFSDTVQLENAEIIVSGGRGLKNHENFENLLKPLCKKLNAAMGASRAAIDSGFVPNELQIGQTGKIVAPKLYFAIGISGAIQHLAGMKDSKIIVAINKDQDAPIFQVANYGIHDDLFKIIPELTEKVRDLN